MSKTSTGLGWFLGIAIAFSTNSALAQIIAVLLLSPE